MINLSADHVRVGGDAADRSEAIDPDRARTQRVRRGTVARDESTSVQLFDRRHDAL
jgi:hypothetical protein